MLDVYKRQSVNSRPGSRNWNRKSWRQKTARSWTLCEMCIRDSFKIGTIGEKKPEDWVVVEGQNEPLIDSMSFDIAVSYTHLGTESHTRHRGKQSAAQEAATQRSLAG